MSTSITRTTVNHWSMICTQQDRGARSYEIRCDRIDLHVDLNVVSKGLDRLVVVLETSEELLQLEQVGKFQAHVNQAVAAVRYFQNLIDAHRLADAAH